MMFWLLMVIAAWLALNIMAPYAVFLFYRPRIMDAGRLPQELLKAARLCGANFYIGKLGRRGGFSFWAPGRGDVVLFDEQFFRSATPEHLCFLIAHEIGHVVNGHTRRRWCMVVFMFFWRLRAESKVMECEADLFATAQTGFRRE